MLDDKTLVVGITRLSLHPFIANPFSYFGGGTNARIHSALGFGLAVVIWWIANSSLFLLAIRPYSVGDILLLIVFLIVGFSAMGAVFRVYAITLKRLQPIDTELYHLLKNSAKERSASAIAGLAIGGAIGYLAFLVHDKGAL